MRSYCKLRARYNDMSATRAAAKVLKMTQTFYERGDKAGRLLAWQIKQRQTERVGSIMFPD